MTRAARVLALFAKAPDPGRVKTRLVPPLSPEGAAELYTAMLADAARAPYPRGCERALWYTPASAHAWFETRFGDAFTLHPQRGATLGARMAALFRAHAAAGASRIVLRGTDSPTLPPDRIARAFDALDGSDLVLCPDRDGGYNLIGLRAPCDALFDLSMSTASVLEQTLAHARELDLRVELLPAHHDVDVAEDLRTLQEELRSREVRSLAAETGEWISRAEMEGILPRTRGGERAK